MTHVDVLMAAHKIRVKRGDPNIAEIHLADAIKNLTREKRESLSKNRSAEGPLRSEAAAKRPQGAREGKESAPADRLVTQRFPMAPEEIRQGTRGRSDVKLYMHPVSNTSRPVRLFIADNHLPVEEEVIDLMTGAHHQSRTISLNPNRQVPTLVDDDLRSARARRS